MNARWILERQAIQTMKAELKPRLEVLLPKLHTLSEANAHKFRVGGRIHADSCPPAGAEPERKGPPDPEDSLLIYFWWKFDRAKTDLMRMAVVTEVELRLERRVNAQPGRAIAGSFGVSPVETSKERDRRIAADYLDLEPIIVAAIESQLGSRCTELNVRRVRIQHKRDPETGRPSEGGSDVAYARQLRDLGLSLGSIAMRMGKPKSTIQGWLEREENGKAA